MLNELLISSFFKNKLINLLIFILEIYGNYNENKILIL